MAKEVIIDLVTKFAKDDAAGNSKTASVPEDFRWRVQWILVTLVTDANVATRQLEFQIRDAADVVELAIRPLATQAASLTRRYLFAAGLPDQTAFRADNIIFTPLPELLTLDQQFDINVFLASGGQAGDLVEIRYAVEEQSI